MVFTLLAGNAVFFGPSGPNNRSCITRASGLPSSFSAMKPSSTELVLHSYAALGGKLGGTHLRPGDTTEPLRPAVRFYERNGYRASGRVTDFFGMPIFEYVKRLES